MREGRRSSARIRRRGLLVRRTTASARVRVGAVLLGHCDKPVGTLEDAGRPLRHLAPELRLADGIARRSARSTEEAPSACYEVCDGFFWGLRCKAAPTVVLLPRVRASAPYWVALHSSGAMERVFGSRGWRRSRRPRGTAKFTIHDIEPAYAVYLGRGAKRLWSYALGFRTRMVYSQGESADGAYELVAQAKLRKQKASAKNLKNLNQKFVLPRDVDTNNAT